jgi:hypothetical protein
VPPLLRLDQHVGNNTSDIDERGKEIEGKNKVNACNSFFHFLSLSLSSLSLLFNFISLLFITCVPLTNGMHHL